MTNEMNKMKEMIEVQKEQMKKDLTDELQNSMMQTSMMRKGFAVKESDEFGDSDNDMSRNDVSASGKSPIKRPNGARNPKSRNNNYLDELNEESSKGDGQSEMDKSQMDMSAMDMSQIAAQGGGYNAIAKKMGEKYDGRIKAINKELKSLRDRNKELERLNKVAEKRVKAGDAKIEEIMKNIGAQTERQNNKINALYLDIQKLKTNLGFLTLAGFRNFERVGADFEQQWNDDAKSTRVYVEKMLLQIKNDPNKGKPKNFMEAMNKLFATKK